MPRIACAIGVFCCFGVSGVILGLSGCAESGPPRKPVFGTVSASSTNPIDGAISFLPSAETKGPAATTAIVGGKFRFNAEDGPIPGKYQVLIVPNATKVLPGSDASKTAELKSEPQDFRLDATVPEQSPFELNLKLN